mgnify:CR=1 FL=1
MFYLIGLFIDYLLSVLDFIVKLGLGFFCFHDLVVEILTNNLKIIFIGDRSFVILLETVDFLLFGLDLFLILRLMCLLIAFDLVPLNLQILQQISHVLKLLGLLFDNLILVFEVVTALRDHLLVLALEHFGTSVSFGGHRGVVFIF